ncbi:MAG: S-layer homology domain-containing protein [Oscillospiraceae bacterium]|nr:S-layer homology domain-containing protein [Oscillospiraceae bacterium]
MAKRKTGKILVALTLSLMMAISLISPALGQSQLATPNVKQQQNYRWLFYIPVEGAASYNVYAFATFEAAQVGTDYVAVARGVVETEGPVSPEAPEGHNRIDVRLLQFEGEATRDLPAGYTPAGIGDSFFPGAGQGDTTNLKPGQYWFRMRAVSDDASVADSGLSEVQEFPLTIAMGPDELRALIEANIDSIGTTPQDTFRLIDLRNAAEFADEGNLRFFDEADRFVHAQFNTQEAAEAIFGHVDDKSAVTIVVICRSGGRTVTASQNLALFGYTNVINAQGINQWTLGLRYDDPAFALRGPGHTAAEPIAPFIAGNVVRWQNVPRAAFEIFAFSTPIETDPANAVHTATVPAYPQDVSGANAERLVEMSFDLADMGIENHSAYFIRMRAVPEVNELVRGYAPETFWGAPSALTVPLGEPQFGDITPSAWYHEAVAYVYDGGIMSGFPDGTFGPEQALTRAEIVTILYRLAGSPDVYDLENPFADVTANQWWTPYILWAYSEGVTTGFVDDGVRTFRGNQEVTMQELAAFIARYQEATGKAPIPILMDYEWPDFEEIATFARAYVNILTAQGLYRDLPGDNFAPASAASRAVVASVLHRWLVSLEA